MVFYSFFKNEIYKHRNQQSKNHIQNITNRKIEAITGQNLTVTIFGFDGRIIKRWTGVKKITSFKDQRNYTFFYTKDGKYVQIPDSVWYIAEEE